MKRFAFAAAAMFASAPALAQEAPSTGMDGMADPKMEQGPALQSPGAMPADTAPIGAMDKHGAAPVVFAADPNITLHSFEPQADWPSPTADDAAYSLVLLDLLEYRENAGSGSLRWDGLGWFGGDYNRLWVKTEGTQSLGKAGGGEAEAQLLYGRLITPYFDLQAGARFATRWAKGQNRSRGYAVLGLQGLSPYRFEIEPAIFLSTKGQISGRLTASYDQLLTQRLILQPRIDTSFALSNDRMFGVGSGINDLELGLRARYEVRREFAPYIGLTYRQTFGTTRQILQQSGEKVSQTTIVAGVRVWF